LKFPTRRRADVPIERNDYHVSIAHTNSPRSRPVRCDGHERNGRRAGFVGRNFEDKPAVAGLAFDRSLDNAIPPAGNVRFAIDQRARKAQVHKLALDQEPGKVGLVAGVIICHLENLL
jgi:hypothetical protein